MQKIINTIYKEKTSGWSFSTSMGLSLLVLLTIGISYMHLPPFLPLYNKMAWGYARLGNKWEIFIPIFFVLICISGNTYLGLKLQQKLPLLARFIFTTNLAISIFTAIFIGKILLIIL